MSLLFVDGFDHYSTNAQLLMKWTAASGSGIVPAGSSVSRWSGGQGVSLAANQWLGFYAPSSSGTSWLTAGAAVYCQSGAAFSIYLDALASLPAIRFKFVADTSIEVDRWDSPGQFNNISAYFLGGAPTYVASGAWHYITVAAYYTTTAASGYLIIYLDGTPIMSVNPIQTNTTGGLSLTGFRLGVDTGTVYFDDVYASNQKGLDSSSTIMPVRIQTVYPSGAGDSTQLTLVGASSNWQALAQSVPPSGTWSNYLYGPADGLSDLYTTGSVIASGSTIYAFAMRWWAKASDTTPCGFAPVYKHASLSPNPYADVAQILGAAAAYYASPIYTSLPGGYVALTVANLNAMQVGLAAARPTTAPNAPAATQYLYLPSLLLSHVNGTQYSVRVTALAPFGGIAANAPSVCTPFTVLDNGFAQAAQLLMEVLRTI